MRRIILLLAGICTLALGFASLGGAGAGDLEARFHLDTAEEAAISQSGSSRSPLVASNFTVLGHSNLGGGVPNGDVWFYNHGGSVGKFAYVGTWSAQCTGQGAKIVDVNNPRAPKWEGYVGARKGSSNEDVVVRRIGNRDVLGIGVQACGAGGSNGLALFDVTNPRSPSQLSFFATPGGVHELDLFQRGPNVYAIVATPFSEWFDPSGDGDFWIVDLTNPASPAIVGEWGAGQEGLTHGPFFGQGSFGASFAHSARASADGMEAFVSYWDLGVVTLDISDVTNPMFVSHTTYQADADGDAHSLLGLVMGAYVQ